MNVVEAPPLANDDAPRGTFVILSLDPIASVADLEDDAATAAASKLPREKYLALVKSHDADPFVRFGVQPLGFHLIPVGHGPPEDFPYACLPVSPGAVRPDMGNPPLLPERPLPWDDCCLHLFSGFRSIITRIHLAPPTRISAIPQMELLTVIRARNAASARCAAEEEGSTTEPDEVSSDEEADDSPASSGRSDEPLKDRSASRESSEAPATPDPEPSEPSDHTSVRTTESEVKWPAKMRVRSELWLDPASADDFKSPDELLDVVVALKQIESEWAKRKAVELLVDKPRTTEWANEVAAAGPPEVDEDRERDDLRQQPDDDLVLPEDAVDEQLGKEIAPPNGPKAEVYQRPLPEKRSRPSELAILYSNGSTRRRGRLFAEKRARDAPRPRNATRGHLRTPALFTSREWSSNDNTRLPNVARPGVLYLNIMPI